MSKLLIACVVACLAGLPACGGRAPSPAPDPPGRIHGVKVLSDNVEDVSSVEAIVAGLQSSSSPGEVAEQLFRLAVKFRHQAEPAHEYLEADHVHDPVKIFNVYGYCQCCCASAILMALGRACGLDARGRNVTKHSVPELFHDGGWHMYDPSLINYFVTDDGHVASVDELAAAGDRLINRDHSRFVDKDGWYPARTHRADPDGLEIYGRLDNSSYEWPYSVGHRVGATLREGEALVRRWGNSGHFLDEDRPAPYHPSLSATGPTGSQAYLKDFFPGYRMGLVGNGELIYSPDLASGSWRGGVLREAGLASTADDGLRPALHLASPGSGEMVVPFWSSYVFLGGKLNVRYLRSTDSDTVEIAVSVNNGLDWKRVWSASALGSGEEEIDLTPYLRRRYRYQLRIRIEGRATTSVGIDSLVYTHEIQHSQRALPLLTEGTNHVTVSAPFPRTATRTLEGSLSESEARNARFLDHRPELVNIRRDGKLYLEGGGRGSVTFPVDTPGDIEAVRFGGSFRCRDMGGRIRLLVSDTGGTSWKEAAVLHGPFVGATKYVDFRNVAPGTRKVLVRYELIGPGVVGMFVFRIDVDYEDPLAGVRPVKVTYEWNEGGSPRTHSRIVEIYPASYTIDVTGPPIMRSLRVEGL